MCPRPFEARCAQGHSRRALQYSSSYSSAAEGMCGRPPPSGGGGSERWTPAATCILGMWSCLLAWRAVPLERERVSVAIDCDDC